MPPNRNAKVRRLFIVVLRRRLAVNYTGDVPDRDGPCPLAWIILNAEA